MNVRRWWVPSWHRLQKIKRGKVELDWRLFREEVKRSRYLLTREVGGALGAAVARRWWWRCREVGDEVEVGQTGPRGQMG
jgi:hypothetical protein